MTGLSSSAPRPPRGLRRALWVIIFVTPLMVLASMLLGPVSGGAHSFHGTEYPDVEPAPAFSLTDHEGRQVGLDHFRGEAVLMFFGFTHCPDVCPLTLQRLTQAREDLGARGEQVRVLLVTVDPERDTPEVLDAYVRQFGPHVTGLTGDPEVLEAMRREYGVYAGMHASHGDGEPMVMHTDAVFGIDREGRLRALLHADGPMDQLRSDIRTLLRL